MMRRRLLVALATVATSLAGTPVTNFTQLESAVRSGVSPISITATEIDVSRRLDIAEDTTLSIDSAVSAILDRRLRTQLFFLHNRSKLSLFGVSLVGARCPRCRGGAIFVSHGSTLKMQGVLVKNHQAQVGGAIFAIASSIILTDCTMTVNSAQESGGVITAAGDSAVIATNCTISMNGANDGGAIYALGGSTVSVVNSFMAWNVAANSGGAIHLTDHAIVAASSCMMTHNFACHRGGAVYTDGNSIVTLSDCAMALNSGYYGGAICADTASTATAANCTMTSNSAQFGGALKASKHSSVTATDCTMTSNSAYWGGAVIAGEDSTVIAVDCTMRLNTALGSGGAVVAEGDSAVNATSCTMSSNSAALGGAIQTMGSSTMSALRCTMTANNASVAGGAVYMTGQSSVTATDCLVSNNVALSAGGVAVGNYSRAIIRSSQFVSNRGTTKASDVMVHEDGQLVLSNSAFESCGAGIVSLGGDVHCDAMDCFPVCTQCRLTSSQPSTGSATRNPFRLTTAVVWGLIGVCLVLSIILFSIKSVRRYGRGEFGATSPSPAGPTASDLSSQLLAHAGTSIEQTASATVDFESTADVTTAVEGVELTPVLPWPVMASSPAAIFVVDHKMHVVLWSSGKKTSVLFVVRLCSCLRLRVPTNSVLSRHSGMRLAAPMTCDPVNQNVSKLPFMEATAGSQLCAHFRWLLEAPGAPLTDGDAIMLHLCAKHGPVLLEMVANVVAKPERFVIVTGRELNSNLSSLITRSIGSGDTLWHGRVAKSEISETATDEAYQHDGMSSADEIAIPNYRAPRPIAIPNYRAPRRAPRRGIEVTTRERAHSVAPVNGDTSDVKADHTRAKANHTRAKADHARPSEQQLLDDGRYDDDECASVWGDCESHTSNPSDGDQCNENMCPLCRIPYRNNQGILKCPLCCVTQSHRQRMLNEQVIPVIVTAQDHI